MIRNFNTTILNIAEQQGLLVSGQKKQVNGWEKVYKDLTGLQQNGSKELKRRKINKVDYRFQ